MAGPRTRRSASSPTSSTSRAEPHRARRSTIGSAPSVSCPERARITPPAEASPERRGRPSSAARPVPATRSIRVPPPMLAALGDAPLVDERLAYEPKYDGIRALVAIEPGGGPDHVTIWSRLGNDKTAQFPDLVDALAP